MAGEEPIQALIARYGRNNEGEFCANCRCRQCLSEWTAIAPWNSDLDRLECPRCGAFDSEAEIVVTEE